MTSMQQSETRCENVVVGAQQTPDSTLEHRPTIPRWAALALAPLVWLVAIPIGHGVVPWARPRRFPTGWSSIGSRRSDALHRLFKMATGEFVITPEPAALQGEAQR
jgi:hypothetical protein